jgi:hypothetical protein
VQREAVECVRAVETLANLFHVDHGCSNATTMSEWTFR